ncbi:MAG: hypothetical protein A3K19_27160 [Lentisphaerae bacterium RIFOXYB12_FULL_65_16]|nr:MAG: hypothetical protein A3K18_11790 [Lentisphaerae bacterium RIFOXYA12_64_32]OGV90125.1 MAG: hypothetical protein A3K19_27160 [Lentisphaerae bacterium RIFOXYB12_FULL_65_16]
MDSPSIDTERFDPEALEALGRIDLIASVIVDGVRQGQHRSARQGFSTEFSDFKPYTPGDDLRRLDWRLYARTDRLFVKCFEAETSLELMLLLDATGSMAWRWQNHISKLRYATHLLAGLACLHMRQQDQVGMLVYDAQQLHHLAPRCRRTQLEAIFALLDQLQPGTAQSLPFLADRLLGVKRHRGVVVVCSDLEENPEAVQAALTRLGGTDDEIILFHLLDRFEIEPPFAGTATHLRDSETGVLVPIDRRTFAAAHQADVQRFRAHWQDRCERLGILYLPVDTGTSYVEAIRAMIAARQRFNEG